MPFMTLAFDDKVLPGSPGEGRCLCGALCSDAHLKSEGEACCVACVAVVAQTNLLAFQ